MIINTGGTEIDVERFGIAHALETDGVSADVGDLEMADGGLVGDERGIFYTNLKTLVGLDFCTRHVDREHGVLVLVARDLPHLDARRNLRRILQNDFFSLHKSLYFIFSDQQSAKVDLLVINVQIRVLPDRTHLDRIGGFPAHTQNHRAHKHVRLLREVLQADGHFLLGLQHPCGRGHREEGTFEGERDCFLLGVQHFERVRGGLVDGAETQVHCRGHLGAHGPVRLTHLSYTITIQIMNRFL